MLSDDSMQTYSGSNTVGLKRDEISCCVMIVREYIQAVIQCNSGETKYSAM